MPNEWSHRHEPDALEEARRLATELNQAHPDYEPLPVPGWYRSSGVGGYLCGSFYEADDSANTLSDLAEAGQPAVS